MPQRNFCDRCGTEMPTESPYYLAEVRVTNEGHYFSPPSYHEFEDGRQKAFSVVGCMKMLCGNCALRIAKYMRRHKLAEHERDEKR